MLNVAGVFDFVKHDAGDGEPTVLVFSGRTQIKKGDQVALATLSESVNSDALHIRAMFIDYLMSKRSLFITLTQAATKSLTNFSPASELA
jgi:hypothetical protein